MCALRCKDPCVAFIWDKATKECDVGEVDDGQTATANMVKILKFVPPS